MGKKKRRWLWVLVAVLLVWASAGYIRAQYFGPMTCGTSEEDMTRYVEQSVEEKGVYDLKIAVRKTARKGRMQAILYEEYRDSDPDWQYGYVIFFERQLFGLRLRHVGMNSWKEGELYRSGSWHIGGRCDMAVYGDNRNGRAAGYYMADAPGVRREDLESDYILDLYILDGIDHLPDELRRMDAERS